MRTSVKDVSMGMSVRTSAYNDVALFDGTFVAFSLAISVA